MAFSWTWKPNTKPQSAAYDVARSSSGADGLRQSATRHGAIAASTRRTHAAAVTCSRNSASCWPASCAACCSDAANPRHCVCTRHGARTRRLQTCQPGEAVAAQALQGPRDPPAEALQSAPAAPGPWSGSTGERGPQAALLWPRSVRPPGQRQRTGPRRLGPSMRARARDRMETTCTRRCSDGAQ